MFEYAADGLIINGLWYPPVYGGQDDDDDDDSGDEIISASADDDDELLPITSAPVGGLTPAQQLLEDVRSGKTQVSSLGPEQIESMFRALGLDTTAINQARLGEAITGLTPQIQGSPIEIREALLPQIGQIRQSLQTAFDTISQRLGRFGGGQIQRERGRALGGAGQELQNIFARQPAIATQQLLQTLGGFSPFLLSQPPLQTVSADIPPDLEKLGEGIIGLSGKIKDLFGNSGGININNQATPFVPSPLPGPFETLDF